MSVKLLTEQHFGFLSFKGGCLDSSESTLVKLPHCWRLKFGSWKHGHQFPLCTWYISHNLLSSKFGSEKLIYFINIFYLIFLLFFVFLHVIAIQMYMKEFLCYMIELKHSDEPLQLMIDMILVPSLEYIY